MKRRCRASMTPKMRCVAGGTALPSLGMAYEMLRRSRCFARRRSNSKAGARAQPRALRSRSKQDTLCTPCRRLGPGSHDGLPPLLARCVAPCVHGDALSARVYRQLHTLTPVPSRCSSAAHSEHAGVLCAALAAEAACCSQGRDSCRGARCRCASLRQSCAMASSGRKRTLLKVIILGDSGCVACAGVVAAAPCAASA